MKKVLLLVPEGSEDLEVAAFVEIPSWTKVCKVEPVEVTTAGWDDKIKLFHGMTIVPDVKINEVNIEDFDALAIPGGWPDTRYFEQCHSETVLNMIDWMFGQGRLIATMCFGIMAVGEAGLLAGIKGTSFAGEACETCQKVKARVVAYGTDFQEKAIVVDHNIISNIGPAVADEVALKMVEMLIGEEAVGTMVDTLMYGQVEPGDLKWTHPVLKSERKQETCASTSTACCGH